MTLIRISRETLYTCCATMPMVGPRDAAVFKAHQAVSLVCVCHSRATDLHSLHKAESLRRI